MEYTQIYSFGVSLLVAAVVNIVLAAGKGYRKRIGSNMTYFILAY